MNEPAPLQLESGPLRLALRPDLGACIEGLWRDGLPVLCSAEPGTLAASRPSGCFALAPYSNRLGFRRFRWGGREHTTQPNFPDSPHSLHGVAWLRPWQLRAAAAAEAELSYAHLPDAHWPFAFELTQRFALTPQSLELRLAIVSTDAAEQPVGLGWHPYFPKRTRSRLHIEIAERWESDASGLPTRKVAQPGIDGDVAHLAFDHCFEGWPGTARIRDEKHAITLSSSLARLVVYTPADKPFYCVEPVSHVSNAIHMADPAAHGLVALPPGGRFEAWMKLAIAPA